MRRPVEQGRNCKISVFELAVEWHKEKVEKPRGEVGFANFDHLTLENKA